MSKFFIGRDAVVDTLKNDRAAIALFDAHSTFALSDDEFSARREAANAAFLEDALPGAGGQAFARELEHIISKIYETPYKPTKALSLYRVNSEIPAGKTSFTARRRSAHGKWAFISGGNPNLPTHSISHEEITFKTAIAGSALRMNMFDRMSLDHAKVSLEALLKKSARDRADEFIDDNVWNSPLAGLSDVLNYPFVSRISSAVAYTSASTPDAIIADLHNAINFMAETSDEVYGRQVRMQVSPRMMNRLAQRYRNAFDRQSILEGVREKNGYLTEVVTNFHLSEAGPGGRDLVIFEKASTKSIMIPRGVTFLPMQREGFDVVIPAYMMYGGVFDEEPAETLIMDVAL